MKIGTEIVSKRKNLGEHGAGTRQESKKTEAEEMQLPIERMGPSVLMGAPQMDVNGKKECAFCEYLLHYLQQVFTYPLTEVSVNEGEFTSGRTRFIIVDIYSG